MGRVKDLTGQKFGRLIALEPTAKRSSSSIIWKCKCECGNEVEVSQRGLAAGTVNSCGCLSVENCKKISKNNIIDIKNKRFGKLVALEETEMRYQHSVVWRCICDCGNEIEVSQQRLSMGNVKSCGCAKSETSASHTKSWTIDDVNITKLLKNNESPKSDSKTGVRGVTQTKNGKYRSQIKFQKKTYNLGMFSDLNEAGEAYKKARNIFRNDFIDQHEEIKQLIQIK